MNNHQFSNLNFHKTRLSLFFLLLLLQSCHSGVIKQIDVYKRDQLVLSETFSEDEHLDVRKNFRNGEQIMLSEYNYSGDLLLRSVFTDEVGNITSIEYAYDGNVVKSETCILNGKYDHLREYIYNPDSLLYCEIHKSSSGRMTKTIKYFYDPNLQLNRKLVINSENDTIHFRYQYDSNGNCNKEMSILGEDTVFQTIRFFNKNNLLLSEKNFVYGEQINIVNYFYLDGNKIGIINHIDDSNYVVRRERMRYNRFGKIKSITIIDYRNFDGGMRPDKEKLKYRYYFFRK